MRLAIVHYHLHPGGVTRIIRSALAALEPHGIEAVVLTGEAPARAWPVPVEVVDGLGYEEWRSPCDGAALARQLVQAACDALGAEPDLWHIHNHSLGKNLAMPRAINELAGSGRHLLLQDHDFAEDGRPALYRRQREHLDREHAGGQAVILYPAAANIHYALLNGRDFDTLQRAAAAAQPARRRVHALPNPVVMADHRPDPATPLEADDARPLWLYPTRAIRRKNLGEFLLWSVVAPAEHRFATTLAPQNPQEQPRYQGWRRLVQELGLPVEFELAARPGVAFEQLVASSHALVTTSVAEGFGMAFLEPWLAGRPVSGRDLPAITHEFEAAGVNLSNLYQRLDVPLAWLDQDALRSRAWQGLERVMGAFGHAPVEADLERTLGAWIEGDRVDFGRLDEALQEQVIRHLRASPQERGELVPSGLALPEPVAQCVERNAAAVTVGYSLAHYGDRLVGIYHALLDERTTPGSALESLDSEAILDSFVAPEGLYLLRS